MSDINHACNGLRQWVTIYVTIQQVNTTFLFKDLLRLQQYVDDTVEFNVLIHACSKYSSG